MKDLIGMKFGKLTVISQSGSKNRKKMWYCKCECGGSTVTSTYLLNSGHTKSCGCLAGRKNGIAPKIKGTEIYSRWQAMKKRCYDKKNISYKDYGARGIKVCDEWKNNPLKFYEWALNSGFSPELTLDRIDVNGDYCPENCKWSTRKEQNRNKRNNHLINVNGRSITMAEYAEKRNINYGSLAYRLNESKFSLDESLNKPIRKQTKGIELNFNLAKECRKRGLKLTTVWARINRLGWSVEDALTVKRNGLYKKKPNKNT